VAVSSLSQLILAIQRIPGATPVYENEVCSYFDFFFDFFLVALFTFVFLFPESFLFIQLNLQVHVIGELGKALLVQLKTMFDAVEQVATNNSLQFVDKEKVMSQCKRIKTDLFYQLYEGLKAMRTTLGDVVKLEYVSCSDTHFNYLHLILEISENYYYFVLSYSISCIHFLFLCCFLG
jgi:hypothetical protein